MTYADIVPYDTPSSLDALRGPTSGMVRVPSEINTSPEPVYSLDRRAWAISLYSDTAREGTTAQQEAILDKGLLLEYWPSMRLPPRCRAAWESKFPELAERRHNATLAADPADTQ
jgi:hypothetical protein